MKRFCYLIFAFVLGIMQVTAQNYLFQEHFSKVSGSEDGTISLDPAQLDYPEGWTFDQVYAGKSSIIVKKGGSITCQSFPT